MKRFMAIAAATLLASGTTAQSQDALGRLWSVSSSVDSQSCILTSVQPQGEREGYLALRKFLSGELLIVFGGSEWTAERDRHYAVEFSFVGRSLDTSARHYDEMPSYPGRLVAVAFRSDDASSFETLLARSPDLEVSIDGVRSLLFDLEGSSAALQDLRRCVADAAALDREQRAERERFEGIPSNPFVRRTKP